ncbi:phosphatidylinositol 3-kinase regulatory subunit beta-like [Pollicipes pollicipes]|uniref:phosphatidylinositol 3-kinase regulatory subunit beta-like n=1 Tax=Pollicipes pollicipes TaxID=41117 RepID=UPI0018858917|nr:phosphatidylinositol 3-kinase regulatory subunit beta-like [Pollicipes pollicipes]
MLSLSALTGYTMDLGGRRSPAEECGRAPGGGGGGGPCAAQLYSYVSGAPGWAATGERNLYAGGYVLSRPAEPLDGVQYLWKNIPPRLAPPGADEDLLDLSADCDDLWSPDDLECDPACGAPPPPAETPPAPEAARVSVSVGPCSRTAEPERRPLHHSGGGLRRAEADSPQPAQPRIEIDLPARTCGAACSGRIKLEISAPCSSSVTVSVNGCGAGEAAAPCGPCAAPASPWPASPSRPPLPPCCSPALWRPPPAAEPSEDEMAVLARATGHLKESGWYYGMLSWCEAQELLHNAARGTFLARDSFDRRFLFALTVQTAQGPTSVRVQFCSGRFRLDAPATLLAGMPAFGDVNSLVEHYARHGHVLYDQKSRPVLRMRLGRPLLRRVPSLQHCCRLALNASAADGRPPPPLPDRLRSYLQQYPFSR